MKIKTYCCGTENPVGIETPRFSWKVSDCDDDFQIGYRIEVFKGNDVVWNSGKVLSDCSTHILYGGAALCENTKYVWQVTVYTRGDIQKSPLSSFVTALYDKENLVWIGAPKEINSPVIYKEIHLDTICHDAIINICGLGFFELYINGKKVSDDLMAPVRTDYDTVVYKNLAYPFENTTEKRVQYCTHEAADYLKTGKNTIAVMLGNGWYRQNCRTVEGIFDYGGRLKMFFRLTNGEQIINSGEDWLCAPGPIVRDNIFYGEIYDSRQEKLREASAVTMELPPQARLEPQLCRSEKIMDTIIPKLCGSVYDAEMCMSGFAEIRCSGKSGSKIEVCYAEELNDDGSLDYASTVGYVDSDKDQIQSDVFILNGSGEQCCKPHFVWHSFRYFEIKAETGVEIIEVKVHYVCTPLKQRASFACSNEMINTFHKLCLNTSLSNIHGAVPMDCAHRERLGYTGDGQLSSLSVMYNYDAYNLYAKWIDDIIDAQNKITGFVPHTAPFGGGGGGPAWGSAVAQVPWNVYMQYGDLTVLKKSREPIKKWIEYLISKSCKGLVVCEESGSWCLGDWCMPSKYPWSEPHLDEIRLPSELVNTVCLINCIDIYKNINKLLGLDIEKHLSDAENEAVQGVNKAFLRGHYAGGEQGSDVFPLYADIVPAANKKSVFKCLEEEIRKMQYCFDTGIIGTKFLFHVLHMHGRDDIAFKMLLNDKYPSFGNMINGGATALWETWEGNGSKNHTAFLSADAWLFFGLAGISPKSGGYKEFVISPHFASELNFLKVSLESEYGCIGLEWTRDKNRIRVKIKIPFNTTAEVCLNEKKMILHHGYYEFII